VFAAPSAFPVRKTNIKTASGRSRFLDPREKERQCHRRDDAFLVISLYRFDLTMNFRKGRCPLPDHALRERRLTVGSGNAAIDGYICTGHETRIVAGEKRNDGRDFVRFANPPKWNSLPELRQ
jgi:hypothetical protein